MMRIPHELRDAEQTLGRYGRWAMDRWKKQHCGSVEHRYKPPAWESAPTETLMPDFAAMDVQRALQRVPLQYRRVLLVEYVPRRVGRTKLRRQAAISSSLWDATHLAGLRMFHNTFFADTAKML